MKSYYGIMLGAQSAYASEARAESFIGADYDVDQDLTKELPERWQEFNNKFRPIWLAKNPGKTRVGAGLSCGALHTICKGILEGDVALSPDGHGSYLVGEVIGAYEYHPGSNLPHRRSVRWHSGVIRRDEMSRELRNSTSCFWWGL